MLEYQIQACKKSMPGKTWYVGTREVRSLYTLKDKVYMVSPETSIYKDLLIKHRLPQISPQSSFFFFFLLLLPSQPPKPTEYTAIPQHQLPPQDANYTLHARHSIPSGALPRPWPWPSRSARRRRRTRTWI